MTMFIRILQARVFYYFFPYIFTAVNVYRYVKQIHDPETSPYYEFKNNSNINRFS